MSKKIYSVSKLELLKYKLKKIVFIKNENRWGAHRYKFWGCNYSKSITIDNVVEIKNPTEFEWKITYKQPPAGLRRVHLYDCVMM